MCQRPKPDYKRAPAPVKKPAGGETDRRLHKLEAELALLRNENAKTREGWLFLMRNTGFLLLALSTVFLLGAHASSNALKSMFEILGTLMLVLGLWSLAWSWRPVAEKLVKA
jgi:protein-S-isoprenylcysteine O-methyltransferase Ste14